MQRRLATWPAAVFEDLSRAMLAGFMVQYNSTMTMPQDSSTEDLYRPTALLISAQRMRLRKPYQPMPVVMPETSKLATALELIEFLMAFVKKNTQTFACLCGGIEPFGAEVEKKFG